MTRITLVFRLSSPSSSGGGRARTPARARARAKTTSRHIASRRCPAICVSPSRPATCVLRSAVCRDPAICISRARACKRECAHTNGRKGRPPACVHAHTRAHTHTLSRLAFFVAKTGGCGPEPQRAGAATDPQDGAEERRGQALHDGGGGGEVEPGEGQGGGRGARHLSQTPPSLPPSWTAPFPRRPPSSASSSPGYVNPLHEGFYV